MFTLNCKGRLFGINEPLVMGIINLTPDSFYEGSRTVALDDVLFRVEQMIAEGAGIIDMGGQSTRPGSERVSVDEEIVRIVPAIAAVHKRFPDRIISVDTFYSRVAIEAADAGASIINDISAGSIDETLIDTVASLKLPYVLMHMKGEPQSMQLKPVYNNVVTEVFDFLSHRIDVLTRKGIIDIIIDPGFGFGKTSVHNFQMLKNLTYFSHLGRPLLVGVSRKGMVYKTLGITADEALNGSTILHTMALMNGASVLRVHDVKAAMEAVKLFKAYSE
jgi:dihydropteroate synthase